MQSPAGILTEIDTSHIAAVSSSDAQDYAQSVLRRGKEKGYVGQYRYFVTSSTEDIMLIFVDWGNQIHIALSFLLNSSAVAGVSLLVVLLLVTLLSSRAIRPVIESMEKQKRFITDAGHEIKTPLAIISANSEVLEMMHGPSEWTGSIQNQVCRLNGLVQNLLTLSKMEESQVQLQTAVIQLSQLTKDIAEDFIPLAAQKPAGLFLAVQPGIETNGDLAGITHLLTILLDNAVKYVTPNGQITVTLAKKGRFAVLEVANTCMELPEGDLDKLFDRFYRGDTSRSRDSGGYGIGLSVAKAIVTVHHGKLSAVGNGAHEIVFHVEL